ncbi:hypothetical protein ACQJBY_053402 [Aegilops geniculata]
MASSNKACATALLLLVALVAATAADAAKDIIASEPTAEVDVSATCMGSLLALSPCLPFFRDAGTSEAPAGCCEGLGGIVQDQPACLCHIFNHTLERAIGVDIPVDRALGLLSNVCGLTPPEALMTSCDGVAMPPLYMCPAPA